MRKKAARSARISRWRLRRAKPPLQLTKETIRTLNTDDLTQVVTGVERRCPTDYSITRTQEPGD